jgi:hypothetical protein
VLPDKPVVKPPPRPAPKIRKEIEVTHKRKPPKRATLATLDDAQQMEAFVARLGALLEAASAHFKAGTVDDAIEFLQAAVEICEENPSFALRPYENLGASLQQVVHGCVSNALAKRLSHGRLIELLTRIEAVRQATIH